MRAADTLVVSGKALDGEPCLVFVANRAYRIVPSGRATPLDEPVPVPGLLTYRPSSNEGALPVLATDEATLEPHKPLTDVLLAGSAHSTRGAVTSLETSLEVGAAHKRVRVLGRRTVGVGAGGLLSFTRPEGFTRMPLLWDHAYGGRDLGAEKRFAPKRGFGAGDRGLLTPDRILSETTVDWIDRPVAASYGPIDVFTWPRAAFLLGPAFDTPKRPVHELASGAVLAEDLASPIKLGGPRKPRVYNRAPAGLAVCRLTGRERVKLTNLHREHSELELDLPDDTPKFILELPGVGERRLDPILSTVSIEPDADRVVLTWAASIRVAMPYPEEMTKSMPRVVRWERRAAEGTVSR